MDRELWLIGISVLVLGLVLLLIVLMVLHRRHLHQISDRLAEGATDNGETLKGVVTAQGDATRKHVSHAVDTISHHTETTKLRITDFIEQQTRDASEFRGQLTVHKTRLQWIIGVIDALNAKVRELFHGKQPPP